MCKLCKYTFKKFLKAACILCKLSGMNTFYLYKQLQTVYVVLINACKEISLEIIFNILTILISDLMTFQVFTIKHFIQTPLPFISTFSTLIRLCFSIC